MTMLQTILNDPNQFALFVFGACGFSGVLIAATYCFARAIYEAKINNKRHHRVSRYYKARTKRNRSYYRARNFN
jgi:hypothetical protein